MKLTQRNIYSAASQSHLIHIVVTGDTSQSPAGSSYAIPLQYVIDLANIQTGDFWISGSTSDGTNFPIKANNDSGLDAIGEYAVAEGYNTIASGNSSHAEGLNTSALGNYSHAQNGGTIAIGNYSHAEGDRTTASGNTSHAEGSFSFASNNASHAEGSGTTASGSNSHAEGDRTIASGLTSHAEGRLTIAGGVYSHAEGNNTIASGLTSHAEGYFTTATGIASHAEGYLTIASGDTSHAEGRETLGSGISSHAEGYLTTASGNYSHAEGFLTIASGSTSHAEGFLTTSVGTGSHVGGISSYANGAASFVHGSGSTASGSSTIVLGSGITGTTDNTVYVNLLNIKELGGGINVTNIGIDIDGNVVSGSSSSSGSTFSGGTVTGPTNFTNGLIANTFSATTYLGLPPDVFVTGGTYSSGTTTFVNSTGGTFNVTGFPISGGTGTTYTADNGLTLTGTNIQLGGSLIKNTTITNNGFDFIIDRADAGVAIQGTNTTGTGIRGSSTSAAGIVGISSTNNGVSGISTTGIPLVSTLFSPSASTVSPLLRLTNDCTTTSLSGHGGSIEVFLSPVGGGGPIKSGELQMLWDDFANSRTGFNVLLKDNVGITKKFGVGSSGEVTIDEYGLGSFSGTPTYGLGVNAIGKVVEYDISGGSLVLAKLTTTERNALTPENGMMIYNTTDNKFQGYENGSWQNLI